MGLCQGLRPTCYNPGRMTDRRPVYVELHPGPRLRAPTGPIDISHICQQVSWGEGVETWTPITITPKMERYRYGTEITPYPGDWIVIREVRDGPAVAFGRVRNQGGNLSSNGPNSARTLRLKSIQAESWLSFMNRVSVYVGVGLSSPQGTMLTLPGWQPIMNALGKSLSSNVGAALSALISELLLVTLPPSLGRATLAGSVRVVHDAVSAGYWTDSTRAIDSVPGPTINGLNSLQPPNGITALGLIQGTFGADPAMVEMFPTLETGGTGAPAAREVFTADDAPAKGSVSLSGRGKARIRDHFGSGKLEDAFGIPAPPQGSIRRDADSESRLPRVGVSSNIDTNLGASIALTYRMRPWRPEPLSVFKSLVLSDDRPVVPVFESVTWRPSDAQHVEDDDITEFDWDYDDESTVNAATAAIPFDPDTPLRFFEQAGLPIVESAASSTLIREEGPRLFSPNWPFLPNYDTLGNAVEQQSYLLYLRTIALQGFQFHYRSKRFFHGYATGRYNPRLRCGKVTSFGMDPQLAANGVVYAYADEIVHSVSVGARDETIRRTTVNFSRGLWDEFDRSPRVGQSALEETRR